MQSDVIICDILLHNRGLGAVNNVHNTFSVLNNTYSVDATLALALQVQYFLSSCRAEPLEDCLVDCYNCT